MRFAIATFAALLLVLSTVIIGSGHIALAYNSKFTRVFSNIGISANQHALGFEHHHNFNLLNLPCIWMHGGYIHCM
jgi:hypothetical protein